MLPIVFSLIFAASTQFGIPRTETITVERPASTNGMFSASSSETFTIRLLDVPTIYEVRDLDKVEESISMTNYQNDVILRKLLPQHEVSELLTNSTPFAAYDIQDIVVSDLSPTNLDSIVVDLNAASLNPAEYGITDMTVNEATVNEVQVIVNQSIYKYLENLHEESKFDEEYMKYGTETAACLTDLKLLDDYDRWQWLNILKSNSKCEIQKIKPKTDYRILAEVRYVKDYDEDLYEENLDRARELGYDSILFRFDTTEDLNGVVKCIMTAKEHGFKAFLTYVGLDNQKPRWNPYCSVWKLRYWLQELCPMAEGLILNWRSTSSHVKLLPKEFFNFMCNTARSYNSQILIFGEVFYGQIDYLGKVKVVCTCPDNISGILVNNMGYVGYNHAYIINKLFSKAVPGYNKMHKVGQVIGYAPYYNSKKDMNFDRQTELEHKKEVERAYHSLDCSTITFLHDGVDDNYVIEKVYDTDDNLLTDENF